MSPSHFSQQPLPEHVRRLDELAMGMSMFSTANPELVGGRLFDALSMDAGRFQSMGLSVPKIMFGHTEAYPNPVLGIPVPRSEVLADIQQLRKNPRFLEFDRSQQFKGASSREELISDTVREYAKKYFSDVDAYGHRYLGFVPMELQARFGILKHPERWEFNPERDDIPKNSLDSILGSYRLNPSEKFPEHQDILKIPQIPYGYVRCLILLARPPGKSFSPQNKLAKVLSIGHKGHQGQIRRSTGAPYFIHSLETGGFAAGVVRDEHLTEGMPIHDVPEDGPEELLPENMRKGRLSEDSIHSWIRAWLAHNLSKETADLVMDLTKVEYDISTVPPRKYTEAEKGMHLAEMLRRSASEAPDLERGMRYARARLGKLIDRFYNLGDWDGIPIQSAYGQLHETLHCMIPQIEESLNKDLNASHTKNLEIIKATKEVFTLFRWQFMCSSVAFYKACRVRKVEPPQLKIPESLKGDLDYLTGERIVPYF